MRAVMNFKAFDILTADVDDEIDVRHIFAAGGEMRHRLHDAGIDAEGAADQIFAITGDAAGHDFHPRVGAHQFDQRFPRPAAARCPDWADTSNTGFLPAR